MVVKDNKVTASSGKYLKYKSNIYTELTLGQNFICINGATTLVNIQLGDIIEVYPVRIFNKDYFVQSTNYNELVTELIRLKYTLDEELALIANSRIKDCSDEEQEFQDWRKVCKETAKHIINE